MLPEKITSLEGYKAMFVFLNEYWKRNGSKEFAILLSSMSFLIDGSSADPVQLEDWQLVVKKVFSNVGLETTLDPLDAYKAMTIFLKEYWDKGTSNPEETTNFLKNLQLLSSDVSVDPSQLENWKNALEKVLTSKDTPWMLKLR